MTRPHFCLLFFFLVFIAHTGFAQKNNKKEEKFTIVNKILFGYEQFFARSSNNLHFIDDYINISTATKSFNGYIGVETQFFSWLSFVNILTLGYIDGKDDSHTPNLYWFGPEQTIQKYDFTEKILSGLFFNYSPAARFYLGVPYVFIDTGLTFSVYHAKEYQLSKVSLPDGSMPHVFLFQKANYNFNVGGRLSLGVSIPLGAEVFLDSTVFISNMIAGGLKSSKRDEDGNKRFPGGGLFTWGFTAGLKVTI